MQLHYPPNYVLDEMEWYEVNAAIKYNYYATKDSWEQTRLLMWLFINANSKHHVSIDDVLNLYWENDKEQKTPVTKKDVERLNEKSKKILELINGKQQ